MSITAGPPTSLFGGQQDQKPDNYLDWSDSSPLNVLSIQYMMYISRDLLVSLVLFPRLFQALLTLTLDMMDDDDDDIVMESTREDFPSLDTIVSQC